MLLNFKKVAPKVITESKHTDSVWERDHFDLTILSFTDNVHRSASIRIMMENHMVGTNPSLSTVLLMFVISPFAKMPNTMANMTHPSADAT